jgi:hypothetical protein
MSRRIERIDILRGLSILAVIAIHVSATRTVGRPEGATWLLAVTINQVSRYAVAVFLLMSQRAVPASVVAPDCKAMAGIPRMGSHLHCDDTKGSLGHEDRTYTDHR